MKKRNISIGVAIAIVALLFAGTGIALAGEENIEDVYFYQESMVEGTGLVMVDKDISTAPWNPAHNLETNLHIHGCGDYEVDQVLKVVIVKNYFTPSGEFNRNVSQSIDYCEDAEMTFKPVALTSGSMTLIDDESSNLLNEDKWDYNKETAVSGCGIAKMDILSTVSGASHIGVVVKDGTDPHITMIRVSEDYIGNFTIDKHMKVKMNKPWPAGKDDKEWLPCPFEADLGHAEFYEGDC
jgi:hypothetical protein